MAAIPGISTSRVAGWDNRPISNTNLSGKNALDVSLNAPNTAFGEVRVAQSESVINIDAVYGIREKSDVQLISENGGTITSLDLGFSRSFQAESGIDPDGLAILRSRRSARYHPGIGVNFRFTATFSTATSGNIQRAGAGNEGNGIGFGYLSTDFGIFHVRGGRPEIMVATITAGAAGNETATVTLGGSPYTASLTAGGVTHAAFELAQASYTGWEVYAIDTEVLWVNTKGQGINPTYSFTSTGTVATTILYDSTGQGSELFFITQASWNIDTLTTETSGSFVLNPLLGNVYQVNFQYLGHGAISYGVENPATGLFQKVHQIQYANNNTAPSFDIPIMKAELVCQNIGNQTVNVKASMSSANAQIEGKITPFRNPDAHSFVQLAVGTTLTNVLTLRMGSVFKGVSNLSEVLPLLLAIAVDGTKNAQVLLIINPDFSGEPNFTHHSFNNDTIQIMTTKVTVTIGANAGEVCTLALGKEGSQIVDLEALGIVIQRNDILCVAAVTSSGTTDVTASITWRED